MRGPDEIRGGGAAETDRHPADGSERWGKDRWINYTPPADLPAGDGSPARLSGTKTEDAPVTREQPRGSEPEPVAIDERQTEAVSRLAAELRRESEAFEHGVVHVVAAGEAKPSAKSVDELKRLKRQFGAWKKEYEARLRKTKAELKKLVHSSERSHGASRRRCGWWKIKAPKCRVPKCCAIRLPSPSSCCCFRRRAAS
ncbi:hypothetical protein GUJ93_ZPchr0011g28552 [Zizania palustris]|uniref:Uncharacterized protein n=1 Tax=Zizania palustris TaxID=103762 RepID=A0A8J5WJU6_ZIZPA|nr:hypothetical protein GUJ93_ZPchr0011g28552 [Zizania palustris]